MIDFGIIKSVGKSLSKADGGVSEYYKKLTTNEYKKLLKIDLIETDKLLTFNQISKIIDIDYQTLKKYRKYLKFAGYGIANFSEKGQKDPFGRTEYFKPITKKEFQKKLKLKVPKGKYFSITKLHSQILKKFKHSAGKPKLKKLLHKHKIFPIGKIINSAGIGDVYKMISDKQYKKLLDIDFIKPPKNIMPSYKIAEKLHTHWSNVDKMIIKKQIKFAGYGFLGRKRIKLYYLPKKKITKLLFSF